MCTQRGFSSCDGTLKYKLIVGLVIGCAKTLNEATVYRHYNKTNKYVTGTRPNRWTSGWRSSCFVF